MAWTNWSFLTTEKKLDLLKTVFCFAKFQFMYFKKDLQFFQNTIAENKFALEFSLNTFVLLKEHKYELVSDAKLRYSCC